MEGLQDRREILCEGWSRQLGCCNLPAYTAICGSLLLPFVESTFSNTKFHIAIAFTILYNVDRKNPKRFRKSSCIYKTTANG